MRDSVSSRTLPNSDLRLPAAAAIVVTAAALFFFHSRGELLYYGDAEAHLSIARRLTDSRTPGYEQIGTVWLPIPHWAMTLPARNDALWRNGLAGAIPAAICHAAGALFLFAAARRIFASWAAAWAAMGLFLANPNVLYLGVIPMTEPFFSAAFCGFLWAAAANRPALAGLAVCAGTLIRYEAWFVIPFAAAFFVWRAGLRGAVAFGAIASLGPLYWLAHNRWLDLDPLLFYRGPYSAKAIQGDTAYPGRGDWAESWLYFRTAADLIAGRPLTAIGIAGALVCAVRRQWVALLALGPPLFYVISLHGAGTPVFVPTLWPNTYYNVRYGIAAIPLLALGGAAIVAALPKKFEPAAAALAVVVSAAAWAGTAPGDWVARKEPDVNSAPRRAYTVEAAAYLRDHYRGGGIFAGFGDLAGIFRTAGIPFREAIHEGNGMDWMAAIAMPQRFLRAEWALVREGDAADKAIRSLGPGGRRYRLERRVTAPNTAAIKIYRLDSTGTSLIERLDRRDHDVDEHAEIEPARAETP
ncbi:MAG: hypothetical protein R2729_16515 [Bryobacteraceae bacterium]